MYLHRGLPCCRVPVQPPILRPVMYSRRTPGQLAPRQIHPRQAGAWALGQRATVHRDGSPQ
eukprot:4738019-Alexandrium_andersonii.AAC.1